MNLAVVNEAVTEMNGVENQFTEEEKNFVVQFAFRSGSKEDTISLIEALAHSADKAESDEIMVTYRAEYDMKPCLLYTSPDWFICSLIHLVQIKLCRLQPDIRITTSGLWRQSLI